MSTEKIHKYQLPPGTMVETTIAPPLGNSYTTVLVSNSQMITQ